MTRRTVASVVVSVLGAVTIVMVLAGVGATQDEFIRIDGRVLWISGATMVVAPLLPVVAGDSAINVDLSQASQDEYMRLTTGDFVTVTGTIADDGNRVIATSIRSRS